MRPKHTRHFIIFLLLILIFMKNILLYNTTIIFNNIQQFHKIYLVRIKYFLNEYFKWLKQF